MEFTKENWENAPEGARLEWRSTTFWEPVDFVGWLKDGRAAIETDSYGLMDTRVEHLRITLPARKVTVQLWQIPKAKSLVSTILGVDTEKLAHYGWTLLGEHTFEIEGEWSMTTNHTELLRVAAWDFSRWPDDLSRAAKVIWILGDWRERG